MLDAIESADGAAFERSVRALPDPLLAARVRAMRADRENLAALVVDRSPEGLLGSSLDRAFGDEPLEADVLARLGEGPSTLDGLPVSVIQPYREPVLSQIWKHRRVAGLLAAAVVVFVSGIAIVSAVGSFRTRPAPPRQIATNPDAPENATAVDPLLELIDPSAEPGPTALASTDPTPASVWSTMQDAGDWWSADRVETVFDAAPLLGEGRLIVYARSGSTAKMTEAMGVLGEQRIGPDHSFKIAGELESGPLAGLGVPPQTTPVLASEEGGLGGLLLAERSGWIATVRRSPSALAALRKRLEDAGMVVEFRVVEEASILPTEIRTDDVLWWSNPPASWRSSVTVPVVIDSLP